MDGPSIQPPAHVWQGRIWPVVWQALALLTVFVLLFVVGGFFDPGSRGASVWSVLGMGLIPFVLLGPLFLLVMCLTVRRVEASPERLLVKRWCHTDTLPASEILGVRTTLAGRAIVVDIRDRRRAVTISDINDALQTDPTELLFALRRLYGPSPLDSGLREAACSKDAAYLSQQPVRFRAPNRSRVIATLDVVCPAAFVTAIVFWRAIWNEMVNAESFASIALLSGAALIAAYTAMVLIDLVIGGPAQELLIDDRGVTLRRRWRSLHLEAKEILGAQQRTFVDPTRHRSHSYAKLILKPSGRGWELREKSFLADPEGLISGILLHRFGEFLPPRIGKPAK